MPPRARIPAGSHSISVDAPLTRLANTRPRQASPPSLASLTAPSPPLETEQNISHLASSDPPTRPAKRARVTIPASDTNQVTSLEQSFRLPFYQGEVYYVPGFVGSKKADEWYEELLSIPGWYQPKLKMYGREITQSRKICAYATEPSLVVKYSGTTVNMRFDYPPVLRKIQNLIEDELGVKFNHCMLNLYENGSVYIGNHRDNKENRVIASLSVGAERTFIMTHSPPSTPSCPTSEDDKLLLREKKWKLANGSLVVMQGETQRYWKHEIPKEPKIKQGRISLTFRQLVF